MTDHFAVLGEPRRPWLDPDLLKSRFLAASTSLHPDRVHEQGEEARVEAGRRYAELNTAYQTLREDRSRLLHLLELERGARPADVQRIPPGTMDLFMEVGQGCRDVDAYLAEREKATSPMLKVQLFRRGLEWVDRIQGLQGKVRAKAEALAGEMKSLNSAWESAPPSGDAGRVAALPLQRLEEIYRVLSYVARWTEQLQERLVQIASG